MASYQGQIDDIAGAASYHYDSNTGWQSTFTYTLDGITSVFNKASLFDRRWTKDIKQEEADTWQLSVTYPGPVTNINNLPDEIPVIVWNLNYEEGNKSLLDSNLGTVNLIPDWMCKVITDSIKEQSDTLINQAFVRAVASGSLTTAQLNAAANAYNHMLVGFNKVTVATPVLVKTATVSSVYEIPWTNVQLNTPVVYKTSTLITQEDVEASLHVSLPTDIYTNTPGITKVNLAYGWLLGPVNKDATSNGRSTISQRFKYGLWPTSYFGNPQ